MNRLYSITPIHCRRILFNSTTRGSVPFSRVRVSGAQRWYAETSAAKSTTTSTSGVGAASASVSSSGGSSSSQSTYRNPDPHKVARQAPRLMRLYWLLGAVGLGTLSYMYWSDFRDTEESLVAALDMISSPDAFVVSRGLDRLQTLLSKSHRSASGVTMLAVDRDQMAERGGVDALVAAFSNASVSLRDKGRALSATAQLIRDSDIARHRAAEVGLPALASILNDASVPSSHGAFLCACVVLDTLAADVDTYERVCRSADVADVLARRMRTANSLDAVARLLLTKTALNVAHTEHGRALLRLDEADLQQLRRSWALPQTLAADGATRALVPPLHLERDNWGQKTLMALGAGMFGFVYGRARWSLRMASAGTPLSVSGAVRFAAKKSVVGKALFTLLMLDIFASEVLREWPTVRRTFPELVETTHLGDLPPQLAIPLLQGTAFTVSTLLVIRRQHYMLVPIAVALAANHWDVVAPHVDQARQWLDSKLE